MPARQNKKKPKSSKKKERAKQAELVVEQTRKKENRKNAPGIDADYVFSAAKYVDRGDHSNPLLLREMKRLRVDSQPFWSLLWLLRQMTLYCANIPLIDITWPLDTRNKHFEKVMAMAEVVKNHHRMTGLDSVFHPGDSVNFRAVSGHADFRKLLEEVLEQHLRQAVSVAANDPNKTRRYHETMAAVAAAKFKKAAMTFESEPMTPGELRLLKNNESYEIKSFIRDNTPHYSNENANCYLALMLDICKCFWSRANAAGATVEQFDADVIEQIFAAIHHKTHESGKKFQSQMLAMPTADIIGVDIKDFWLAYTGGGRLKISEASDRNTANNLLTVPRLARMSTILTGLPHMWGLSTNFSAARLGALLTLWECEKQLAVDVGRRMSHSIAWYLALGKEDIINPLTDDQEQCAERTISSLLGRTGRFPRVRPGATPYVHGTSRPGDYAPYIGTDETIPPAALTRLQNDSENDSDDADLESDVDEKEETDTSAPTARNLLIGGAGGAATSRPSASLPSPGSQTPDSPADGSTPKKVPPGAAPPGPQ